MLFVLPTLHFLVNNKMNILIFSTDDHLYPAGGAESAMGEITKRLPDIQFDLVCARIRKTAKKYEEVGNVRIHRLGFGFAKLDGIILALFGHFKALQLYKKYKHDLIWSIMASYGAFSAVRIKKKYNIPFLLTLQEGDDIDEILHKVRFVRKQFNEIFESADAIQPISHFLRNWGIEMGFNGTISDVIPNGVDVSAFTEDFDKEELLKKRKNFGFSNDATVIITSSRLEKKNGVGDIIDALSKLSKSYCLVVCGDGSLDIELKQKVKDLNLENRVRFLGYVPIETIPKLLKASDIFIRPSLTEGLGNSFLEAMAAELPTIGTPVGGIPDFLEDGKTGFMCEPKNPDSIAKTIERIKALSDGEKNQIRDKAKKIVLETYDWDRIAASMRGIFDTLVKK